MNDDVSRNLVVFRLKGFDEPVMASAPTQAEDAVEQAWANIRQQHKVRGSAVSAVYSEWQPSAADRKFMAKHFRKAECTYSFARPAPGEWERAFAEARAVMAETQEARQEEVLPVLWSTSSPRAGLLDALPHQPLVPGRLSVALAVVSRTPQGKIGMQHITRHQHEQMGTPPLEDLFGVGYQSLARGLKFEVRRSGEDTLVSVARENLMAASALALPDLYAQLTQHLGAGELLVGLPCPDEMYIARAESGLAATIREQVLGSPYETTELVPSVLRLGPGGMELLAERDR
ncbi:hypothetical protein DMA12_23995 [Amycolatopsis balhimycina DSM 5908]|uniref:Uncharacterized protein n=1 Tax=Amycolatopsis balhimycina DSM 5908 TaxID=1081091 RepID=A0A428WF31_AMYBA|nr:hypothetical protein [Amycolatopsis balhimycina]RSM41681.1 hypothetical protein DMA12_23995 [Amycolatopsis balhimycina DSM 5908]